MEERKRKRASAFCLKESAERMGGEMGKGKEIILSLKAASSDSE